MRIVFRVLALLVCAGVAFQAAVMVWAVAGLELWVSNGGVFDKSLMESESAPPFKEAAGFMLHGMNGMMIIPIIALLLLISSFFAKARRGRTMALIVVGLVALQILLGLMGHGVAVIGMFHGLNALLLFAAAVTAFVLAGRARTDTARHAEQPAVGTPTKVEAGT